LSCLAFGALAINSNAAVYYWDPQGSATPTAGNLTGTWDTSTPQWSTTKSLTASPVVWSSGVAACFSAGTTPVSTPFVVTVDSTITIGGIFNGALTPPGCPVTLKGAGSLDLAAGADAFSTGGTTAGTTAITIPLTGAGQAVLESSSKTFFSATNTYSGGTIFGYPNSPNNITFSGTLIFSNGYAFGTGPIQVTPYCSGALSAGGTSPITITNAFYATNATFSITGLASGLTFTGPWVLGATPNINAAGSGNLISILGPMSGTGGFSVFGQGTIALGGANTYTGATTISNGILSIVDDSNLGAVPGTPSNNILLNGGTLVASNTFTLNQNRLISLNVTPTISVANGKTLTYNGTVSGAGGFIKSGSGTLALGNANTYLGTTAISGGALEADCQIGSATSTNSISITPNGTLSGLGLIGGSVFSLGKVAPGTPSGPATLTFTSDLYLSSGGTYSWTLSSNSTTSGFSTIALNTGNLGLGGGSKFSINWTGTSTQPSTNNPFWLAPEAWGIISLTGVASNSGATTFTTLQNGNYAAGNFTNYATASGITLLYQPNFAYFNALTDAGHNVSGGENLSLTNFSELSLFVWSTANASLSVSNWTLIGQMSEQTLADRPGYSRYTMNVVPTVSPTYYIAGNMVKGPYLSPTVTASIVSTPNFVTFNVMNTNVAISATGVLGLVPSVPSAPIISSTGNGFANGAFQLKFSAGANANYIIQDSSDLIHWSNISTGMVTGTPMTFVDSTATNTGSRYYRVLLP